MVDMKQADELANEPPVRRNGYPYPHPADANSVNIPSSPSSRLQNAAFKNFLPLKESTPVGARVLLDLVCIGGMAVGLGYAIWHLADAILPYPNDRAVHMPSTFVEVKEQATIFREMIDSDWYSVTLVFSCLYIFKQAFSLPGSSLMNVLAGVLYGFQGFFLASILTGIGATCCYVMSVLFGSRLVSYLVTPSNTTAPPSSKSFATRFRNLQGAIQKEDREGNLYIYLIGIRVFPFTPNWFLNMAAPHVGVGIREFFVTILIGLIPYNFVTTQAGTVISKMNSLGDVLTFQTLGTLMLMAAMIVGIAYAKHRYGVKKEAQSQLAPELEETVVKGRHRD